MTYLDTLAQKKIESFSALVWRRFRRHRLAAISLYILLFMCALSMLAPFFESWLGVSHDVADLSLMNQGAQWPHLLGSNDLGQDVFTRLIYGGRISLTVGIISAVTSAIIGGLIGLLAGYYGGIVDLLLMRFTDAMLSVPVLPLMIVFSALDLATLFGSSGGYGSGLLGSTLMALLVLIIKFSSYSRNNGKNLRFWHIFIDAAVAAVVFFVAYLIIFKALDWHALTGGNFGSVIKLVIIIVFFGWMTVARLARAATLQLKDMEFITAARALGASNRRIIIAHILPNALAPIIVAATLEVGDNILYEAALSFLGLGVQPPVSSWGNMLNNAIEYIKTYPMLAFWPGFCILTTVACFNFLGDGLRDALDPHQVMK